ncbi:MAG: hypothetical protein ACTSWD_10790, partial [Candidatus Heimdallarchaeota archaeon]
MLPILKSMEFSKILPLSEKSIEKIIFREGINKFLAENGSGKTTLTDLIEHSLVRDAHAFAWNVFAKKRVDKTAYIKAEWLFGSATDTITHELTDSGARTRVTSTKFSNKAHTRDMYSDYLYSRTNLTLEQTRKLFEGVYYKRENDLNLLGTPGEESLMDFFELLNKAIRMDTPATIKLRNQIGEIKRQIDMRKNSKRKNEATIEKIEIVFSGTDSSADAIDTIGARKGDLERNNLKLKDKIEKLRADTLALEEEDQKILDKLDKNQETLLEVRRKIDGLKSEKYSLNSELQQLENELKGFKKLGNIQYNEVKEAWKKKQNCELCGSSVFSNWEERVTVGCPSCGTGWNKIPKVVKDAAETNNVKIKENTRDIKKEIEKISHKLRAS